MTIQFIDLRLSEQANSDAAAVPIPATATPLVFGDIGIQTAGVLPANQGLVRVQLWGYVKVVGSPATNVNTISIFRNGALIFTTTIGVAINLENEAFGFSAVDFPPIAAVQAGQIRYTAEISTPAPNAANTAGARNFSGMAAAGNFTG